MLLGTAALATLCLLAPLRRFLTRWLNLDPASPVHTVGLVFATYLVAAALALLLSPAGAVVSELSNQSLVPAALGEETLFRGALQPRFRPLLTALIFTVGHVQYTLSPALLEILAIGLVLGWLRERTNTTTCMVVHAGYNLFDTLIMRFFL
jgi:membrane protease YdiL (CAAX protease family)